MNSISQTNITNSYQTQSLQKAPTIANSTVTNYQTSPIKTNYKIANLSLTPINFSSQIKTSLNGKEEIKKFNEVSSLVDNQTKKQLNALLKNGKLLNNNSNDNTTTLDNLYKIATTKRISGLNPKNILEDAISTISNPFRITQKFGTLPIEIQNKVIQESQTSEKPITATDLDVKSSTCPAASIEFNLAHKMPAEFVRMAEGLTSENISVTKRINTADLSQSLVNTIWMLNEFGTEHKLENWHTLNVTMRPDRNAIIRARVQATKTTQDERSALDVLMQSTFMNVGAQNTYNSLTDIRKPKYNEDNSGLIDIEKNFAEELATGKGKVCVTYQQIDDNGRLVGYECEQQETLSHIKNTLAQGDNVIIGYTYCDNENNVIGGHEITIIGIETDRQGNEYFVCNDTDDEISNKITYPVAELLPKIHHAGIPKSVLVDNVEFVEGWRELMEVYKMTKAQQEIKQSQASTPYTLGTPLTVIGQAA